MNGLKGFGCRALASMAMLSGAMFTLLLVPAYAQQDVSPDWYDPAPSATVAHPVQPAAVASQAPAVQKTQQTAKSLSPAAETGKAHLKNARLDQRGQSAAHKNGGAKSEELASCSEPTALGGAARECPAMDDRRVASVEVSAQLAPVAQH
jgi:hypothetical protein